MTASGRKILGVIGGVGPLATALFMETVIRRTEASTDQEHLDMIVFNHTEIPDRTAAILDAHAESPAPLLAEDARRLEEWGADVIVIPCNTAHYFYPRMSGSVGVPFLHMIRETAGELERLNVRRAGILATVGTIRTGLYQAALEERGIRPVVPSEQGQAQVMRLIYEDIKAGRLPDERTFRAVREELGDCDRIVLGCTELSVLKRQLGLDSFYLDALEVLADCAIRACGKRVRA